MLPVAQTTLHIFSVSQHVSSVSVACCTDNPPHFLRVTVCTISRFCLSRSTYQQSVLPVAQTHNSPHFYSVTVHTINLCCLSCSTYHWSVLPVAQTHNPPHFYSVRVHTINLCCLSCSTYHWSVLPVAQTHNSPHFHCVTVHTSAVFFSSSSLGSSMTFSLLVTPIRPLRREAGLSLTRLARASTVTPSLARTEAADNSSLPTLPF
jgi:hypothetical protein